jgi:uncharacterized membrane protein
VFEFLLLGVIVFAWHNRRRLNALQDELDALRHLVQGDVAAPKSDSAAPPAMPMADAATAAPDCPAPPDAHDTTAAAPATAPDSAAAPWERQPWWQIVHNRHAAADTPGGARSFEEQFGAKLPVWIGGLALILAGFFLVKYSIETGLLSPVVRIVLGLCFGGGLLAAAQWVLRRSVADGTRLAQVLSGAGIADLYICICAAASLYALVPPWLGFVGMAAVTAGAVLLALVQGVPIAVFGLVGGFLTPVLIHSGQPNALLLFSYLYLLMAGLLLVIRQRGWWFLALPTVLGAFLWALFWLFGGYYSAGDSLWLGLFIIACSATLIGSNHQTYATACALAPDVIVPPALATTLHYSAVGGAVLLMSLVTVQGAFSLLEWGLFGVLTLGGIVLAHFNQRLYGLVPWFSLLASAGMIVFWYTPDAGITALVIGSFAVIHLCSGYVLQARSARPLLWAGLVAASSLGYFLLAYWKLRHVPQLQAVPLFWGMVALVFAALAVLIVQRLHRDVPQEHPQRPALLSVYAAVTTAFLTLALTIELEREFLSVALAMQMTGLCWLYQRYALPALRRLAQVLAGGFALLLVPQIVLLLQLTAYSLMEAQLSLQDSVPFVQWPLFQLGVPAIGFYLSSYLLRRHTDDRLVRGYEVAAIALVGVMGYYLSRHAFHPHDNILFVKAGFIERGAISNVIFLYGLGCLALGLRYTRRSVVTSGAVLIGIALFRILYFDLLRYNPLWNGQIVGAWPVLNGLWLPYGLPILWTALTLRLTRTHALAWTHRGLGIIMLLLGFVFVTMQIRQLYQGTLLSGATSNAEIYTYSAVWLIGGFGLLGFGTWRGQRLLRIASLVIMIVTVGKVFLYDAAELTGLYRVVSFFGLGLSLLALNWFYARYVFKPKPVI